MEYNVLSSWSMLGGEDTIMTIEMAICDVQSSWECDVSLGVGA